MYIEVERQEKWEWGLAITRDELEDELAGKSTLNERHRVLTYLHLGDRRPRKRTHCPGH